jgi:hypothetical protein
MCVLIHRLPRGEVRRAVQPRWRRAGPQKIFAHRQMKQSGFARDIADALAPGACGSERELRAVDRDTARTGRKQADHEVRDGIPDGRTIAVMRPTGIARFHVVQRFSSFALVFKGQTLEPNLTAKNERRDRRRLGFGETSCFEHDSVVKTKAAR